MKDDIKVEMKSNKTLQVNALQQLNKQLLKMFSNDVLLDVTRKQIFWSTVMMSQYKR